MAIIKHLKLLLLLILSGAGLVAYRPVNAIPDVTAWEFPQFKLMPDSNKLIKVSGAVVAANGGKVGPVSIFVSWETARGVVHQKAAESSTGAFEFSIRLVGLTQGVPKPESGQSSPIELLAVSRGKGVALLQMDEKGFSQGDFRIKLAPATVITGRLVHRDGTPASGIDVHIGSDLEVCQAVAFSNINPMIVTAGSRTSEETEIYAASASSNDRVGALSFAPPSEATAIFHARTGSNGQFTISGCPHGSWVSLITGEGLRLASGSNGRVPLSRATMQNIGVLSVVRPGSLSIRVVDSQTGSVVRDPRMVSVFDFQAHRSLTPDGITFSGLEPGSCWVSIGDRQVKAKVVAGSNTAIGPFFVRQSALKVFVCGTDGKPEQGVSVKVTAGTPNKIVPISRMGDPVFLNQLGMTSASRTDSNGIVLLNDVPLGVPVITVRATLGNDQAIWAGPPESIGERLSLRLKVNALITVNGRLLDRQNKPLQDASIMSLHWIDSDRSTWINTAHQATCDEDGRFSITGLERGQAFSLISRMQSMMGRLSTTGALAFESPRFVTTDSDDEEQDLGDITVHPMDGIVQLQETYGDMGSFMAPFLGEPAGATDSAAMEEPISIASPTDVAAARTALRSYGRAVESGNIEAIRSWTSQMSRGWSKDKGTFLQYCSMEAGATSEEVAEAHPILILSKNSVFRSIVGDLQVDPDLTRSRLLRRDIDQNPRFVVFAVADPNGSPHCIGIVHKEAGNWKVVALLVAQLNSAPALAGINRSILAPANRSQDNEANLYKPMYPAQAPSIHEVAERYLKAWATEDFEAMHLLTSSASRMYFDEPRQFRSDVLARKDGGICPVNSNEGTLFIAVPGLSSWDRRTLTQMCMDLNIERRVDSSSFPGGGANPDGDPISDVPTTSLSVLRYRAGGEEYLMLLSRANDRWLVVEPAIKL